MEQMIPVGSFYRMLMAMASASTCGRKVAPSKHLMFVGVRTLDHDHNRAAFESQS